jgi:ribose/xylose/arabinose/galactoside ABC-type transport system permease subunit
LENRSKQSVLLSRLLATRELGILVVAVLTFACFSLAAPRFFSAQNLIGILREASLLCILAVGMTYLLVAGEFDLSVGANYGFLVTALAFLIVLRGVNPWLAAGLVILLGLGVGVLNGLLVTQVKLQSFIATLGSLAVLRGAANIVSGGYPISARNESLLFYRVIGGRWLGRIPNLSLLMILVLLVGGFVLAKTRFGYEVYATGGDEEAARFSGINTAAVKLICFALTGGLCGLIAILLFGWIGLAPYNTGTGFELRVIAAAIVGGTGLFGGRGTIFGTFVGAMLLGMLTNGLILLGVRQFWDGVAAGTLILVVATLDLLVRRSALRLAEIAEA